MRGDDHGPSSRVRRVAGAVALATTFGLAACISTQTRLIDVGEGVPAAGLADGTYCAVKSRPPQLDPARCQVVRWNAATKAYDAHVEGTKAPTPTQYRLRSLPGGLYLVLDEDLSGPGGIDPGYYYYYMMIAVPGAFALVSFADDEMNAAAARTGVWHKGIVYDMSTRGARTAKVGAEAMAIAAAARRYDYDEFEIEGPADWLMAFFGDLARRAYRDAATLVYVDRQAAPDEAALRARLEALTSVLPASAGAAESPRDQPGGGTRGKPPLAGATPAPVQPAPRRSCTVNEILHSAPGCD